MRLFTCDDGLCQSGEEGMRRNRAPKQQGMATDWIWRTLAISVQSGKYSLAEGLLECGWQGKNMNVVIYRFNLKISPKMSYGMFECDIVMSQNDMLMVL